MSRRNDERPTVRPLLGRLFLLALTGVALAFGAVAATAGPVVLSSYAAVVLLILVVTIRRMRAAATAVPPARAEGRTCTCCTRTVHDPVQVI